MTDKSLQVSSLFLLGYEKSRPRYQTLVDPLKLTYGIPVETCRLDWRGLVKLGYQDLFVNRAT